MLSTGYLHWLKGGAEIRPNVGKSAVALACDVYGRLCTSEQWGHMACRTLDRTHAQGSLSPIHSHYGTLQNESLGISSIA